MVVFLKLAKEAGLPAGVLNVVTASRARAPAVGKELCENPIVKKISFTGSTNVGKVTGYLLLGGGWVDGWEGGEGEVSLKDDHGSDLWHDYF